MEQSTLNSLVTNAEVVRSETNEGKNTASRIGSLLKGIATALSEFYSTYMGDITAIKGWQSVIAASQKAVEVLQSKVTTLQSDMTVVKGWQSVIAASQKAVEVLQSKVTTLQSDMTTKVNAVTGKGLSTNDYTNSDKYKLSTVENGATNVKVDKNLDVRSMNPVQNRVIADAINRVTTYLSWAMSQIGAKGVASPIMLPQFELNSESGASSFYAKLADVGLHLGIVDAESDLYEQAYVAFKTLVELGVPMSINYVRDNKDYDKITTHKTYEVKSYSEYNAKYDMVAITKGSMLYSEVVDKSVDVNVLGVEYHVPYVYPYQGYAGSWVSSVDTSKSFATISTDRGKQPVYAMFSDTGMHNVMLFIKDGTYLYMVSGENGSSLITRLESTGSVELGSIAKIYNFGAFQPTKYYPMQTKDGKGYILFGVKGSEYYVVTGKASDVLVVKKINQSGSTATLGALVFPATIGASHYKAVNASVLTTSLSAEEGSRVGTIVHLSEGKSIIANTLDFAHRTIS